MERVEDPILVFDRSGRVLALNAALERMLGWSREDILGRAWSELYPSDEEPHLAMAWLRSGAEGVGRRIELPARTGSGAIVTLVMNIAHIGTGEQAAAVGTVIASRAQEPLALPCAEHDEYYEISSQSGTVGTLRYLWSPRRVDADTVGQPCYVGLYGRTEPCVHCPAFTDGKPGEVRSGVVQLGNVDGFGLVTAEFTEQRVRVNVRRISRGEVNELVRARIDLLAEEGGLSGRERSVLALLIEGKSADDIGEALGISPRTAKFHQTNILQKLGVDSRLDLFRLLVG
jgi:PAS domain S-box-containing protein